MKNSPNPQGSQELQKSTLSDWKHIASGKVRELYVPVNPHPLGDIVMVVATNRISAFDYILDSEIPGKGEILTKLSLFWFDVLERELGLANHFLTTDGVPDEFSGRAMICKRLDMIPVECVARGFLTGSAYAEYKETGGYQEFTLPKDLTDGSEFPEPIFTPAMKAEIGDHDENVSYAKIAGAIGENTANQLRTLTLEIYKTAATISKKAGFTLVDTKFEFGFDPSNSRILTLGDEVLTPDSSRYWDNSHNSIDKQYVRNYLLTDSGWSPKDDVKPPALPLGVIRKTQELYQSVLDKFLSLN